MLRSPGVGAGGGSNFAASSSDARHRTLNQGPVLNPDGSINNMALVPDGESEAGRS